jgi:hypothetical protein
VAEEKNGCSDFNKEGRDNEVGELTSVGRDDDSPNEEGDATEQQ